MKKYEEYLQAERQYSTLTLKAYREDIGEFVNFFSQNGGFKDFSAIDRFDVRIYLNNLYERKLAKTSIARKISSLRSFYHFLIENSLAKKIHLQTLNFVLATRSCQNFYIQRKLSNTSEQQPTRKMISILGTLP